KRRLAELAPAEMPRFLDDLNMLSGYVHGTHVAGIALRGNPAARLVVVRMDGDWHTVPKLPTPARVEGWVRDFTESVAFFQKHRARVVNMSWGVTPADYEQALEANNAGGTPDERRKQARVLWEIAARGLRRAIESAPEILFVAAAGNSNQDNRF